MVGGSACRNDVSMDGKGRGQASDRATLETTTAMADVSGRTTVFPSAGPLLMNNHLPC